MHKFVQTKSAVFSREQLDFIFIVWYNIFACSERYAKNEQWVCPGLQRLG